MLNANNCAPRQCLCGRRLHKPEYGWPWVKHSPVLGEWLDYSAPVKDKVWFVPCKCGLRHIWTHPGRYIARANLPLFDCKVETTRYPGRKGA